MATAVQGHGGVRRPILSRYEIEDFIAYAKYFHRLDHPTDRAWVVAAVTYHQEKQGKGPPSKTWPPMAMAPLLPALPPLPNHYAYQGNAIPPAQQPHMAVASAAPAFSAVHALPTAGTFPVFPGPPLLSPTTSGLPT
ncbi:hypothetical protein MMC14_003603 [Varicellaria rhodocarpa]|nr:hypothetical protein [Varicellaria rhodocarpa]